MQTAQLKPRHRLFVAAYFEADFNASEAYRRTFRRRRNANVNSAQLMKKPHIRRAIDAEMERLMEKSQMDRDEALEIVTKLARDEKICPRDRIKAIQTWATMTGQAKPPEGEGSPNAPVPIDIFSIIMEGAKRLEREGRDSHEAVAERLLPTQSGAFDPAPQRME